MYIYTTRNFDVEIIEFLASKIIDSYNVIKRTFVSAARFNINRRFVKRPARLRP